MTIDREALVFVALLSAVLTSCEAEVVEPIKTVQLDFGKDPGVLACNIRAFSENAGLATDAYVNTNPGNVDFLIQAKNSKIDVSVLPAMDPGVIEFRLYSSNGEQPSQLAERIEAFDKFVTESMGSSYSECQK